MRDFFVNLFRDETFGPKMGLFNLTHIIVLLVIFGFTLFMALHFYKKEESLKQKILNILIIIIVCMYFGDFFVHPLMNNENSLIVDKLPFHLCTSACLLIAITRIWRDKCSKWYHVPQVLGLVGALMYITVPTGVNGDYLFCYRSLQTLIYHGLLFAYGILALCYGDYKVSFKNFYVITIVVVIQLVISLLANNIYSTSDHHYDWYFSTGSSFGVSPYLMPFLIFIIFNAMSAIIYGIYFLVKYLYNKKDAKCLKEENN